METDTEDRALVAGRRYALARQRALADVAKTFPAEFYAALERRRAELGIRKLVARAVER